MPVGRRVLGLTVLLYLSPLLGLLVELALARTFGASAIVDAYRIAALLLIYGSGLLNETVLRNAVIPTVVRYRTSGDERGAWRFTGAFTFIIILMVMPAVAFIALRPDSALRILGPGLTVEGLSTGRVLITAAAIGLTIRLLAGGLAGALQSYGVFWVPPASQMLLNLSLLIAILMFGWVWQAHAISAAMIVGVVIGLMLHVAATARIARQQTAGSGPPSALPTSTAVRSALWFSLPLLLVAACQQWQSIILARTLTEVGEGALALYGYGEKLMQLGVLPAIAFVTVSYPIVSEAAVKGDSSEISRRFVEASRYLLFMMLPLALAIAITAPSIVRVLFGQSALSDAELAQLANLCRIQAFMIPVVGILIFLRQFMYATRRTILITTAFVFMAMAYTAIVPFSRLYGGLITISGVHIALLFALDLFLFSYIVHNLRLQNYRTSMRFIAILLIAAGCSALIGSGSMQIFRVFWDDYMIYHLLFGGIAFFLTVSSFFIVCYRFKIREAHLTIQFLHSIR